MIIYIHYFDNNSPIFTENQRILNFNQRIVSFVIYSSSLLYGCEKRGGCTYAFRETIQGISGRIFTLEAN